MLIAVVLAETDDGRPSKGQNHHFGPIQRSIKMRHYSDTWGINIDENMVECRQLFSKQLFQRVDILGTVAFSQVDFLYFPLGIRQNSKSR